MRWDYPATRMPRTRLHGLRVKHAGDRARVGVLPVGCARGSVEGLSVAAIADSGTEKESTAPLMSAVGQKLKSSTRADDFRFAANSGPDGSMGNQDFQFLRGPQGRHPRGHRFVIALVSWGYDLPEPRAAYSVGAVNPTE